jgi:hypothetical protein
MMSRKEFYDLIDYYSYIDLDMKVAKYAYNKNK